VRSVAVPYALACVEAAWVTILPAASRPAPWDRSRAPCGGLAMTRAPRPHGADEFELFESAGMRPPPGLRVEESTMNAQEQRTEDRTTWVDVVGAIIAVVICLGAVALSLTFIDLKDRPSAMTSVPMNAHSSP